MLIHATSPTHCPFPPCIIPGSSINRPGHAAHPQVLDALLHLGALSVRGNHDDAILQRWRDWREGSEPLKPEHAWLVDLEPRHVQALDVLPFTISIPSYGISVVSQDPLSLPWATVSPTVGALHIMRK